MKSSFLKKLRLGRAKNKYDFLDLGCKVGNSIGYAHRKYGGRGLGVDFKPGMIKQARENGYDAIVGDALKLDFPANSFRYISMMHFLEHLPNEKAVKQTLKNCKKWAREFFFIHHPSFEDVEYLKKLGFKIDWTDWIGHTAMLTTKDFKRIFKNLGLNNYEIRQEMLIEDSSHEHVVPLDAPTDTLRYEKKLGSKKKVKFDKPIYGRLEILVNLK